MRCSQLTSQPKRGQTLSPWIEKETVDPTIYDHTSIIATLRGLFLTPDSHLTRRDAQANDVLHLLKRSAPRVGGDLPDLGDGGGEVRVAAQPDLAMLVVREEGAVGPKALASEGRTDLEGQLDALAIRVDHELHRLGVSRIPERVEAQGVVWNAEPMDFYPNGDILRRFQAYAASQPGEIGGDGDANNR